MFRLDPPIPLDTPKGKGWAHLVLDYSQEHDLLWVVFLDASGECWSFPNHQIRMRRNMSLGIRVDKNQKADEDSPWV